MSASPVAAARCGLRYGRYLMECLNGCLVQIPTYFALYCNKVALCVRCVRVCQVLNLWNYTRFGGYGVEGRCVSY